jgi:ribosomal protein S18 acetylase RimI-like enzyme
MSGQRPTPELRSAVRPEDAAAVRELVTRTGVFSPAEVEIAVELVEAVVTRGSASGYSLLFAEQAGALLGYACWGDIPGTESGFDLYWIVVSPERQGLGVGALLLDAVERQVVADGGHRLWIDTSGRDAYAPARRFYSKQGYAEAARLPDFYRDGDAKVIFVKRLV